MKFYYFNRIIVMKVKSGERRDNMCPILTAAKITNSRFSSIMAAFVSCQREKCALWNSKKECCSFKKEEKNE